MSDADLREFAMEQRSCLDDCHRQVMSCRQYLSQLMSEKTKREQRVTDNDKALHECQQRLSSKQERLAALQLIKEQAQMRMAMAATFVSDVEQLKEKYSAKECRLRSLMSDVERRTGQQQMLQQALNAQVVSVGLLSADVGRLTDEIALADECNIEYEEQLRFKRDKMRQQLNHLEVLRQNIVQLNHQLETNGNKRIKAATAAPGLLRQNTNYHSLPLSAKLQSPTDYIAWQNGRRTQHCQDTLSTETFDTLTHKDNADSGRIVCAESSGYHSYPSSTVVGEVPSSSTLLPSNSAQWSQRTVMNNGVSHSENLRNTSYRMMGRFAFQQADVHQSEDSCSPVIDEHNSPLSSSGQKPAEITDHFPAAMESMHTRPPVTLNEPLELEPRVRSRDVDCPSLNEAVSVMTDSGPSNRCAEPVSLPDVVGYMSDNVASQSAIGHSGSSPAVSAASKVPPPVAQKPTLRYPSLSGYDMASSDIVAVSAQSNVMATAPLGSVDTATSSPKNTGNSHNETPHDRSSTTGQDLSSAKLQLMNMLDESLLSISADLSLKEMQSDDSAHDFSGSIRLVDKLAFKPSVTCPVRRRLSSELSSCSTSSTQGSTDTSSVSEDTVGFADGSLSKVQSVKKRLRAGRSRRVQFEPLALLLDAALEGEIDLLQSTLKVCDVSAANDEGITALHNAICAGHLNIAEYLVNYGCDVNAPDNDGWTPLHCAASCNNTAISQLLVQHGACVFSTAISDHEKPSEKCEPDEDDYESCLQFLQDVEMQMRKPGAAVYAAFDYSAENADELTFSVGDELTVVQCSDDIETEWWWCQLGQLRGYVPQNLIALHPRKVPSQMAKSSSEPVM